MFHVKEYIIFMNQIGFVHPGQMKVIFDSSDALERANPRLKSILLAGKGRIASLEGNLLQAQSLLDEALHLAEHELHSNEDTESANSLAYIHYEFGGLYRLLRSKDTALQQYTQAKQLTKSVKLNSLIEFQIELLALEIGGKSATGRLIRMVEKFKSNNSVIMYIIGLHRLGLLMYNWRRYKEAEQYFKEALYLAENDELQYLVWTIKNSIGLLLYKQKKIVASVIHYESFIDSIESHYIKAIALKNLALRYRANGNEDKAIELCKEGLEYSQRYNVISVLPTYATLIGDLIVAYTETPHEAYHYYKLGYEESIRQEKSGVPLNGPRLQAVKKYVEYLASYLPKDFSRVAIAGYFEWTRGKSWVRIQDLFHYNLFVYHFIHTGIGKATFKQLSIKSSTFYSLAKRMRDLREISFPNFRDADLTLPPDLYIDALQKYVQLHREKTFKKVSEQFEKDIYEFLFKENGYNKKRLSESLGLSYSVVLKKTKAITEVSESQPQPSLKAPE